MDTQGIIQKILSDANAEADKIKADAAAQQAAEQTQLDNQLKRYREETEVLTKKASEDKQSHMLAAARMSNSMMMLNEKRALLDEVFIKASQQLASLPDDQYKDLMKKLLIEAVETGDEEVIVDPGESRITHDFIKQVNRELGPGYKGNIRLSDEKENIKGGFILQRGRVRNNVSVNVLIDKARKELEAQIAKELFSEAS